MAEAAQEAGVWRAMASGRVVVSWDLDFAVGFGRVISSSQVLIFELVLGDSDWKIASYFFSIINV